MDGDNVADEMYWAWVNLPNGGIAELSFFARESEDNANSFLLQKSYDSYDDATTIFDLSFYITTSSQGFVNATVDLPADPNPYHVRRQFLDS